jgi:hypothetical protein
VLEEVARAIRPGDELVERCDLVADHSPPPVAGLVEHGRRGLQADPEALHQLDERQAAQLFTSIHSPPRPAFWRDQPPVFVVPQRRGVQPEHAGRFADRHDLHMSI